MSKISQPSFLRLKEDKPDVLGNTRWLIGGVLLSISSPFMAEAHASVTRDSIAEMCDEAMKAGCPLDADPASCAADFCIEDSKSQKSVAAKPKKPNPENPPKFIIRNKEANETPAEKTPVTTVEATTATTETVETKPDDCPEEGSTPWYYWLLTGGLAAGNLLQAYLLYRQKNKDQTED